MTSKQRSIPMLPKEDFQVQTDVKLLESYLNQQNSREQEKQKDSGQVRLSEIYNKNGVLRPFSDQYLLKEFTHTLEELKSTENVDQAVRKRLELLEHQIQGLLKRNLLIHKPSDGKDSEIGYYETIGQKEKELIKIENQQIRSEVKLQKYSQKIQALERQVIQLQSALDRSQGALEQNKIYQDWFATVSSIVRNNKNKAKQLQKIMEEKITPSLVDVEFQLQNISKSMHRDMNSSVKLVASSYAKQLDRMIKSPQLSEELLSQSIADLYSNFKSLKGISYFQEQYENTLRYQGLHKKYESMLVLFKNGITQVLNEKNKEPTGQLAKLQELIGYLQKQGVACMESKGWIHIIEQNSNIREVTVEDGQTRQILGLLASQLKKIYVSYPQLKETASAELLQLYSSNILDSLTSSYSFDRIKEIITCKSDVIKVDNIYTYESSKDRQLVFHLRVLIKCLLEEVSKIRSQHGIELALDEGILELLKAQIVDLIDTEDIIALFRPPPKIVEVIKYVEKPYFETKILQKGVPINKERPIKITQNCIEVVQICKEVPVYVEVPVDNPINKFIPVKVETQKALQISCIKEVITERIVEHEVSIPVQIQRVVELREQIEIPKQIIVEKEVEVVKIQQEEKLVEVEKCKIEIVQKIVEKPVYLYETKQLIKEVEVKVDRLFEKIEYIQVQKTIPHIIHTREIVYLEKEVPVQIKVYEEKQVQIIEYRDRIIPLKETIEIIRQMPVYQERQLIKEVEKQIFFQKTHFIKGDTVECIRQVEVFVDRPIIKQILITKDVEIQKIVPLYITQQVPIITEINVPHINENIKQFRFEVVKLVPVKTEIIKEIKIQKPIPVIVEKEIIKIQTVYVEKIVEKIVEVPRVVEVERIVEKIVIVPRIIEKIVEVPRIIEKICIVEQPILQIVEIPIPTIIIQEIQKIVEVIVEKKVIQYITKIEFVEVQKIVQVIIQRDRPIEIEVERRIPFEVLREIPVETFRDRIQYQKIEIHEIRVESLEVPVPIIVQQRVPMIVEKPVITQKIIQKLVKQIQIIQCEKAVRTEIEIPKYQEILVERAVITEVALEIPGPESIKYIYQPKIVELYRDKIVEIVNTTEVPKTVYLQTDKIIHEIQDRLVEVPINKIVTASQLIQINRPVYLTHYKEIPVEVSVSKQKLARTIIEQIKQVQVERERVVEVEIFKEKIIQVTNQIKEFLKEEIVKEVQTQVCHEIIKNEIKEIPSDPVIIETKTIENKIQVQDRCVEKIYERIIMLPQIVEVVRTIHQISEIQNLGVAVDVDLTVHTQQYVGVSEELRKSLAQLLLTFKANANRQPDLKNLIVIIQKYLVMIDEWIKFPKIIQVVKEVEKIVEKQRIVLVPTEDKDKECTLSYMVEKLVQELRRLKHAHKITLNLDEELLRIFFNEKGMDRGMEEKFEELSETLKNKYASMGAWADSNPFLVNTFLQEHFIMKSTIESANRIQRHLERENQQLHSQIKDYNNKYNSLHCFNRKIYEDHMSLVNNLKNSKQDLQSYEDTIRYYENYELNFSKEDLNLYMTNVEPQSIYQKKGLLMEEGYQYEEQSLEVNSYIEKISKTQLKNIDLQNQSRVVQNQNQALTKELQLKNQIVAKLEAEFQQRISKLRDQFSKNPNFNQQLLEENKISFEKSKNLERELDAERRAAEKNRKQNERNVEKAKKQFQRQIERKEKQIKDITDKLKRQNEREISRLKVDYEKIKRDKERLDSEIVQLKKRSLEQIKSIRQKQSLSGNQNQIQLTNENITLRKKIQNIEADLEKIKTTLNSNISEKEKEISRLNQENQRIRKEKQQSFTADTELINKNINLQKKIKTLESEVIQRSDGFEVKGLKEKIRKLQIELQTSKMEMQIYHKSKLPSTTYGSGFKAATSIVERYGEGMSSPKGESGYKSGFVQKQYISPGSAISREEEYSEERSESSSRRSGDYVISSIQYKSQMTLKEFMDLKQNQDKEMYLTFVMIKIIQKMEDDAANGMLHSYSPNNIYLYNFNTKNLEKLTIKFGAHITNKKNKNDGIYLAPEILAGGIPTKKSLVFTLGTVLDELIHGDPFFKSYEEIQNPHVEFKVRGEKLNPILKNSLFEMMNKNPEKRLELTEAKRRLSLQKYITTENKANITATSRIARSSKDDSHEE